MSLLVVASLVVALVLAVIASFPTPAMIAIAALFTTLLVVADGVRWGILGGVVITPLAIAWVIENQLGSALVASLFVGLLVLRIVAMYRGWMPRRGTIRVRSIAAPTQGGMLSKDDPQHPDRVSPSDRRSSQ